ncbi:MAG: hypothetical protein EPN93_20970 [Spirochaetes bacterium]|nr:MAG: hypothetical protein EPN93_20970 [Spirochaetota bacterium]
MKKNTGNAYLGFLILVMLVLPLVSVLTEAALNADAPFTIEPAGKWFLFWGIGMRLLIAGLRQALNPVFTARDIFNITDVASHALVRELGFSNICLGLPGVVSLFFPHWRLAAACAGGLYMGIAGIQHVFKKPTGSNEITAMISDLFIFLLMAAYVLTAVLC